MKTTFKSSLLAAAMIFLGSASGVNADSQAYQLQAIYAEGERGGYIDALTSTGEVVGHTETSFVINGTNNGINILLWDYSLDTGTQTIVGLTDSLHTAPSGLFKYNTYLNAIIADSGEISGISRRYINGIDYGADTWVAIPNQGPPQLIGILDAEHTGVDGERDNFPSLINSSGLVVGTVARLDTSGTNDVWLFDPATGNTQLIGVLDSAHTNLDGTRSSYAAGISNSGYVVGSVTRYAAGKNAGQDAWVYSPSTHTAQVIALSSDFQAYTVSAAMGVNDAGQMIGTCGGQAWFANSAQSTAHLIGPIDSVHVAADGSVNSLPLQINAAGQVLGQATRYSAGGSQDIGQDVWYYNPLTGRTEIIGLTDAAHTRGNGGGFNEAYLLNSAGEIAGDAERLDGSGDGWLFDPATDQTNLIPMPAGDLLGQITRLSNDGTAIGYYYDISQATYDAFTFTEAEGFQSLGSLVSGGLASAGWLDLGEPYQINSSGQIAGLGTLADGQTEAYLLTPVAVPEPLALPFLGLAISLLRVKKRVISHESD